DGNPSDAMVLATASGIVTGSSTDIFELTPITPTAVSGNFFVGFMITGAAGQFPASLDQSSADQMRSYVAGSGTPGGGDIYNLENNDIPVTSLDSVGLPGNWLIRADAVPEPSTWAMIGLGGALLLGLMRYRARVS
ncbi:MAG TPA: PEP-CTERM sorting domain-containing protein, partial [Chthoniobacterales bacterium]